MAKKNYLSWPQVANNFLLRLTSTGQLPLLAVIGLLFLMVYKTPQQDIGQVWGVLEAMLDRRSALGYSLAVISGAGWLIHARRQRRNSERELDRVSRERTQAQQAHFKKPLESSEK